jgi:glycosyltransferase EpsF
MKKILVVVDNLNRGGIASVVLNISEAMDKEKYIFDFITYQKPNEEIVLRLKKINSKYFIIDRLSKTTPFEYIKKIRKIINENGSYNAMHAHTSSFIWLACLAGKLEKIPVRVGHAHGSKNERQFLFSGILYSMLKSFNRKFCTKMLSCAETSGKFTFGKDYLVLPNFIDHEKYIDVNIDEKDMFMKKYNIPSDYTKYCFVGYLGGEKNPLFVLKLFKLILTYQERAILLIAGDGPDYNNIMKFLETNHMTKNVVMFGNTSEVKKILQVSDIMLMPSFSEGMSIAAIEAQISGVHCIVSKGVPVSNDIKVGLFHECSTFDINMWCNLIQKVLKDNHTVSYDEAINALRKIGYDKASVVKELENIYT